MSTELARSVAHAGLRAPATSGATSISVELITGAWPTVSFTALLEDGTSRKEQVLVTGVSGNTLTVTRAQGGTSAVAHDTMSSVDVITTTDDLALLETILGAPSVATHEADTTSVHGITDTSALALTSALTAHDIDTTSVHGITDTAQVALKNAANTFTLSQAVSASGGKTTLALTSTGSDVGLTFGGDTTLYRQSATVLMTDGTIRTGTLFTANVFTANQVDVGHNGSDFIGGFNMGGDTNIYRSAANILTTDDDLRIGTAGKGLRIAEGANARMGVATLVGGTVVVSNTSVTANTRIMLTVQALGTVAAPKAIAVTARTASTSFTITSADGTDTSVVAWQLFEPA